MRDEECWMSSKFLLLVVSTIVASNIGLASHAFDPSTEKASRTQAPTLSSAQQIVLEGLKKDSPRFSYNSTSHDITVGDAPAWDSNNQVKEKFNSLSTAERKQVFLEFIRLAQQETFSRDSLGAITQYLSEQLLNDVEVVDALIRFASADISRAGHFNIMAVIWRLRNVPNDQKEKVSRAVVRTLNEEHLQGDSDVLSYTLNTLAALGNDSGVEKIVSIMRNNELSGNRLYGRKSTFFAIRNSSERRYIAPLIERLADENDPSNEHAAGSLAVISGRLGSLEGLDKVLPHIESWIGSTSSIFASRGFDMADGVASAFANHSQRLTANQIALGRRALRAVESLERETTDSTYRARMQQARQRLTARLNQ